MLMLSPHHSANEYPDPMTLDQKIEVFADRIESWQLDIARKVIEADIPNREVALLYIVMSYFEMIGRYREGETGKSTEAFKAGMKVVFPEISGWSSDLSVSETFLESLYGKVRSGLYHVGMPNPSVLFINNDNVLSAAIGYYEPDGAFRINSDILARKIVEHFSSYVAELRNTVNAKLRANFERRYDSDN